MQASRIYGYGLLFVATFFFGCGDKIQPGNTESAAGPAIRAAVAEVEIITRPHTYEAVGTVKARKASTLSGKLMGTVTAVNVREGDRVKTGDILVVIDDRQVAARLRQAEAALAEARRSEAAVVSAGDAAKAGAELARTTYKRYLSLLADDSVSRQEFDEVKARYEQAEALLSQSEAMIKATRQRIRQASAAVAAARVSKKDAAIRAPYSGKVTAKMIEVGDLAAPGTPFLMLEESGNFEVNVTIPETRMRFVSLNQKLAVTASALQKQVLDGVVHTIAPAADPQSRSFVVKVGLPPDAALHSGMFARVAIPLADERLMLIPTSAVVVQGQLTGVFLVDSDQRARFRLIRTGREFGEQVEVISGLREKSRYVISPPAALKDGDRVEVGS